MEKGVAGIYGLAPAQQMFFVRCFMPDQPGMSSRKLGNESAKAEELFRANRVKAVNLVVDSPFVSE